MNSAAILLITLALTACSSTDGLLVPDSLYPKALTTCQEEPVVTERTDKTKPRPAVEKAGITADYRDAWKDCHDVVGSWGKRRDLYTKQYETEKYNWFQRMYRTATGAAKND